MEIAAYVHPNGIIPNPESMKTKALDYQSWDDVVFENRNKEYGAYPIRRSYSERLFVGLLVSSSLIGMFLFFPSTEKGGILPKPPVIEDIIELHPEPIIEINRHERIAPPVQNTELPPQVVRGPVEPEPIQEPVEPITTSGPAVEGEGVTGVQTGTNVGIVDFPVVDIPKPEYYLNPEVPPQYADGQAGMIRYIQRNLRYPNSAQRLEIEGTVFVSFIVNGDGSISNVEVIRGIHPDCDREAARVISKMPGWTGGMQAGNPVRVKMVLPIKFALNKR
jgi:periplasmic protein TonB